MPFVNSQGVRIHYEVEGQGPPLVLHHGLPNNLQSWKRNRFTNALNADYKLILVDARGHGDSEKPHDSQAYGPEMMTGDIVAVLNDLDVEKTNFWGYSMGGRIGFQLTRYHSSHFSSYILGGSSPFPRQSAAAQHAMNQITTALRVGVEKGPEAVVAFLENLRGQKLPAELRQRFLSNDYNALYALSQNMFTWNLTGDRLSKISVPCLLYAGDQDPRHDGAKEAATRIPQASFVSLLGLNHARARDSHQIIQHAKKFLTQVTNAS